MRSAFLAWCISVLAFLPVGVSATGPAPDELIRKLSDDVLEILLAEESLRTGETSQVVGLVEQVVLPHFNIRRMTMLAVGRDWRDASAGQQKRLMDAFYGMLVRTYSSALTHYRDQTVRVRPLRMSPSDKITRVQTEIRRSGGLALCHHPVTIVRCNAPPV